MGCNYGGGERSEGVEEVWYGGEERSEGVEEEREIHLEDSDLFLVVLLFLGDDFGFEGASLFFVFTCFFFFVAVSFLLVAVTLS